MRVPYEEWWEKVGDHLDKIGAGASMCASHAKALTVRPDFKTWAEDELDRCEAVLLEALRKVCEAKAIYREKPPCT